MHEGNKGTNLTNFDMSNTNAVFEEDVNLNNEIGCFLYWNM